MGEATEVKKMRTEGMNMYISNIQKEITAAGKHIRGMLKNTHPGHDALC